ncbi:glutathione binding-like protein [Ideonella sp.]|uniref:glutathione binding-like protein n=1 Tax=Ideonella sp. TaxID=1929293 RepID=UPI002B496162|nr:glutathione binding-like protein [Ideonella sp.]HJV71875.1 glutathione binding-like protein [Ideonella sp.]
MTIILYDCATAPSPRRARILLAEKGLAHETVQVDLRNGEQLGGLPAIAEAMRNSAPAMANRALPGPVDYLQIPELARRGLARVQQFFTMLNEHLVGRDFIAADRFSIADITAVVAVDFARVVKVKPGEMHPHLLRWRAAMGQREAMAL